VVNASVGVAAVAVVVVAILLGACGHEAPPAAEPSVHGTQIPRVPAGNFWPGGRYDCPTQPRIVTSREALSDALCRDARVDADAIDWSTHALILYPHRTNTGVSKLFLDGPRITIVVEEYCQGTPPAPVMDAYLVPRATEIVVKTIPTGRCGAVP